MNKNKSAFLFGPRGTGKSTLAKQYGAQISGSFLIQTFDLLEQDTFSRLLTRPELLRSEIETSMKEKPTMPVFVLIDEVQKIPPLLDEVHNILEKHRGQIHFLLTGSSARKLKRTGSNLLAGRAWTLHLHPLTHRERDVSLERMLQLGSIPSVVCEPADPVRTLRAYVGTYLKEEIQQETAIRNLAGFTRFLEMAAQMHGEPINFAKLAKESKVSPKTAKEYFEILIDTLIAFRIDAWGHSVRKQIQQSSKFYFFDCGVLNALRGDLQAELKQGSYRYGKLFETFVILECLRLNDYLEKDFKFCYWRTNIGQEVDLIIKRGSSKKPLAIEIKSAIQPELADTRGLLAFASENPDCDLCVVCRTSRAFELGDIPVLPWKEALEKIFENGRPTRTRT